MKTRNKNSINALSKFKYTKANREKIFTDPDQNLKRHKKKNNYDPDVTQKEFEKERKFIEEWGNVVNLNLQSNPNLGPTSEPIEEKGIAKVQYLYFCPTGYNLSTKWSSVKKTPDQQDLKTKYTCRKIRKRKDKYINSEDEGTRKRKLNIAWNSRLSFEENTHNMIQAYVDRAELFDPKEIAVTFYNHLAQIFRKPQLKKNNMEYRNQLTSLYHSNSDPVDGFTSILSLFEEDNLSTEDKQKSIRQSVDVFDEQVENDLQYFSDPNTPVEQNAEEQTAVNESVDSEETLDQGVIESTPETEVPLTRNKRSKTTNRNFSSVKLKRLNFKQDYDELSEDEKQTTLISEYFDLYFLKKELTEEEAVLSCFYQLLTDFYNDVDSLYDRSEEEKNLVGTEYTLINTFFRDNWPETEEDYFFFSTSIVFLRNVAMEMKNGSIDQNQRESFLESLK